MTPDQAGFGLQEFSIRGTIIDDKCPRGGECDPGQRYRSYDGSCNNLQNPLFGSVNTPYKRFIPASYGGKPGENLPRGVSSYSNTTGYVSTLPSVRLVSNALASLPSSNLTESMTSTHMVMQWGQLVDHDIIATAGEFYDCCQQEIK